MSASDIEIGTISGVLFLSSLNVITVLPALPDPSNFLAILFSTCLRSSEEGTPLEKLINILALNPFSIFAKWYSAIFWSIKHQLQAAT